MTFTLITNRMGKYISIFWFILFISVILGFGTEGIEFVSEGTLVPNQWYQMLYVTMLAAMWSSAILHVVEIYKNYQHMTNLAKFSTIATLIGVCLIAGRGSLMILTVGANNSISPATLAGAFTIAIGTAGNSIGRMYDRSHYG